MKVLYKVLQPCKIDGKDEAAGNTVRIEAEKVAGLVDAGILEAAVEVEVAKGIFEEIANVVEERMGSIEENLAKKLSDGLLEGSKSFKLEHGATAAEKTMTGAGFKGFGHFCVDVFKAGDDGRGASEELKKYDAAIKAAYGVNSLIDSEGGYLVPVEQSNQLLERALEASIVRPRAQILPMSSSHLEIPAIKDDSRSSSLFGGVIVYRTAEAGVLTKSQPKFSKVGLKLNKLSGLCYVTDEMLSDSPISVEALVMRLFPSAFAYKEDEEFLTGNGAGKPLGVQNAANNARIVVAKEAAQAADTVVAENVINMYSRCYGKNNAIWIANHDTFPQLATMTLNVGTGGVPLWLPGNNQGLAGAPSGTLMGRPLVLSEQVPTLGDAGDIGLYDFSQYLVGERAGEGLQTATSIHLRFDYGETAFRFTLRNDGQPWWRAPLTPKNGSTLSPFVTLAERA